MIANLNLIIANEKKMFWLKIVFLNKNCIEFLCHFCVIPTYMQFGLVLKSPIGIRRERKSGERKREKGIFVWKSQPDIYHNVSKMKTKGKIIWNTIKLKKYNLKINKNIQSNSKL